MLENRKVRKMRKAETILNIIRQRGKRELPVEDVYRLLYQPDLYIQAYGKIYRNDGAMTEGANDETADGMSLEKIGRIIEAVRFELYRWTPVRRTYIAKKNGKRRPLGLPTWSDKLLQEVIRSILEAYYEPRFSDYSHGFRPGRGCHTALKTVTQKSKGTKWFIEGDICSCFDNIDHMVVLDILRESFPDNRFLRLMKGLLDAGYLEDWKFNVTYSGVPQGGIVSPILSNIVLDRLDKFVEKQLIPKYTRGTRRSDNPSYTRLLQTAARARKRGEVEKANKLHRMVQKMPSMLTDDPDFRRLSYVRYADDFILGFAGPKSEALAIKREIAMFLRDELNMELSDEKTLVTHARDGTARFLGYEVHILHDNTKHDRNGMRCINGAIGLRVPLDVRKSKCAQYKRNGKPCHRPDRVNDDAYSIVSQYQAEFRGLVEYYRMAYNLGSLSIVKWTMETSLVKTLAKKFRTTCPKIYARYIAQLETEAGTFKVLKVTVERQPPKKSLEAYFGGVSMRWNKNATIHDSKTTVFWNKRVELVKRLLAQQCEICGSEENIEVHHIRKLADLKRYGQSDRPEWVEIMSARKRKTLVLCSTCHHHIHKGRYDGKKLRR